jgi:pimeloyl-ACP methyl ester carboxylesterase
MLALAHAAAYPQTAGPLVLIGCGTFDTDSRAKLRATLDERSDDELRRRLARLPDEFPDAGQRALKQFELCQDMYAFEPLESASEDRPESPFDIRAHQETWDDMIRLQAEGIYPASLSAIRSPVLMLHGRQDPHPGKMIRDCLRQYIPQLEYRQWGRCGHSPWQERHVRNEFLKVLRDWLQNSV